jgi:hypothetical protein
MPETRPPLNPPLTARHPDIHRPWSDWAEDQILHVAVAYSNPFRWESRRRSMNKLRDHMAQQANVRLYVGELAFGDRPWEVTTPENPYDLQLRTRHEAFYKENLQNNIIRSRWPSNWAYGMCCDADFHIVTPGWGLETVQQLQHYEWVQPFSSYLDVTGGVYGQANAPYRVNSSFMFNYIQNGYRVSPQYHNGIVGPDGKFIRARPEDDYGAAMGEPSHVEGEFLRGVGATGGAYAFRRSAYEAVGGLLDRCILGHADWYMAYQLVGVEPPDIHSQKYSAAYKEYVKSWGKWAERLRRNVGYVDAMATHAFHGSKTRRGYSSRDKILASHQFDPYCDIHPDAQGIWQFDPEKWQLRDDIRRYFISRFEDDPNIYGSERLMV